MASASKQCGIEIPVSWYLSGLLFEKQDFVNAFLDVFL
jgi:hypothetical protein